jgi:hypothetical protein
MHYADKVFLRFADVALQAERFDAPALEPMARAFCDADALAFAEPFAASLDEVRLGAPLPGRARIDALWPSVVVGVRCPDAGVSVGELVFESRADRERVESFGAYGDQSEGDGVVARHAPSQPRPVWRIDAR